VLVLGPHQLCLVVVCVASSCALCLASMLQGHVGNMPRLRRWDVGARTQVVEPLSLLLVVLGCWAEYQAARRFVPWPTSSQDPCIALRALWYVGAQSGLPSHVAAVSKGLMLGG
jgi:hypothetical protein